MSVNRIYAYTVLGRDSIPWSRGQVTGVGHVKVGQTRRDVKTRLNEQLRTVFPGLHGVTLLFDVEAVDRDGQEFTDRDVHRLLAQVGIDKLGGEWFAATSVEVRSAVEFLRGRGVGATSSPRAEGKTDSSGASSGGEGFRERQRSTAQGEAGYAAKASAQDLWEAWTAAFGHLQPTDYRATKNAAGHGAAGGGRRSQEGPRSTARGGAESQTQGSAQELWEAWTAAFGHLQPTAPQDKRETGAGAKTSEGEPSSRRESESTPPEKPSGRPHRPGSTGSPGLDPDPDIPQHRISVDLPAAAKAFPRWLQWRPVSQDGGFTGIWGHVALWLLGLGLAGLAMWVRLDHPLLSTFVLPWALLLVCRSIAHAIYQWFRWRARGYRLTSARAGDAESARIGLQLIGWVCGWLPLCALLQWRYLSWILMAFTGFSLLGTWLCGAAAWRGTSGSGGRSEGTAPRGSAGA